jgi:hypothetical protein
VHDAARTAQRHGTHTAAAAVAVAAHDVLREYFPLSGGNLDADLAASLAMVPNGTKEAAGVRIGAAAADRMIASRMDDGRNDTGIVYSKAPALGIWQPPATGMALPWLGFVDPVVDVAPVALDGPDAVSTMAYARDYEEVRTAKTRTFGTENEVSAPAATAEATGLSAFSRFRLGRDVALNANAPISRLPLFQRARLAVTQRNVFENEYGAQTLARGGFVLLPRGLEVRLVSKNPTDAPMPAGQVTIYASTGGLAQVVGQDRIPLTPPGGEFSVTLFGCG